MPRDVLIPVLGYPVVSDAVAWLCAAFGFRLRWQVGDHRAQLAVGDTAAIAVVQSDAAAAAIDDHVMIRVSDVAGHRRHAIESGATCSDLEVYPYGERQYTATDLSGRRWVFSESVRDVDPAEWGADAG